MWLYLFLYFRYSIAVLLGHTEPDFPYISDTATYSPESCIFGQAVNVGAFLGKINSYHLQSITYLVANENSVYYLVAGENSVYYLVANENSFYYMVANENSVYYLVR